MSDKNSTTHTLIERQLNVYLRERSSIWQCSFQVDGKWQRTSTGVKDLALAKKAGLLKDDFIVSIGEIKLLTVTDLSKAVNPYSGKTVDVDYVRNRMRHEGKLTLNNSL
jgi:S1-C subfamily serine protease